MPVERRERTRPGPLERLAEALVAFNPVIFEAADVAHPVAVDRGIEARRQADQPRSLRPFRLGLYPGADVAPLLAQRTDGVGDARIVPGPRFEAVVTGRDRSHRTDVHEVAGENRMDAFLLESGDLAAVAAIDDVDLGVAVHLAHEPDAAGAQDAAVPIQHQRRAEIDVGLDSVAVEDTARKFHPTLVAPERVGEVLQRTVAAL